MTSLSISKHAIATVDAIDVNVDDETVSDLAFYSANMSKTGAMFSTVDVTDETFGRIVIRCFKNQVFMDKPSNLAEPDLTIAITCRRQFMISYLESTLFLIHEVAGKHTTSLTLDDVGGLSEDNWADLSSSCEQLRFLRLGNDTAGSLTSLLSVSDPCVAVYESLPATTPLFSALQRLVFFQVDMFEHRTTSLCDALLNRKKYLSELPLLVLQECELMSVHKLERLEKVVRTVEWDGLSNCIVEDVESSGSSSDDDSESES
ncbi:hypothetical protein HWV62_19365 [Athelia sp. TMB]|nr:hypothetical protein HWV62_19365 [Athelia sp. TMB]